MQFRGKKYWGKINDVDKISDMFMVESFQVDISKNSSFVIYSKSAESGVSFPVTRMEYQLDSQTYKYLAKQLNIGNGLKDLRANPGVIREMFRHRIRKDTLKKIFPYLDKRKRILEREYLAFKGTGREARAAGRTRPVDVMRHLEKYWIFDNSFVRDIVEKYDPKHVTQEVERIKKRYKDKDGIKKLNEILGYINSYS